MEPSLANMKVPELKNDLQVGGIVLRISVAKNFWILMYVEAHELAIVIGDQMGISVKLVTESESIPDAYSLKSNWSSDPLVPV